MSVDMSPHQGGVGDMDAAIAAWRTMAECRIERQEWTAALDALDAITRADPRAFSHKTMAGVCLRSLGRLPEAAIVLAEALFGDPRSASAHFEMGLTYEALGRTESAARHFARALELQPSWRAAQDAAARVRLRAA